MTSFTASDLFLSIIYLAEQHQPVFSNFSMIGIAHKLPLYTYLFALWLTISIALIFAVPFSYPLPKTPIHTTLPFSSHNVYILNPLPAPWEHTKQLNVLCVFHPLTLCLILNVILHNIDISLFLCSINLYYLNLCTTTSAFCVTWLVPKSYTFALFAFSYKSLIILCSLWDIKMRKKN